MTLPPTADMVGGGSTAICTLSDVEFTRLRPGEKVEEGSFSGNGSLERSPHRMIMTAVVPPLDKPSEGLERSNVYEWFRSSVQAGFPNE